MSRAASVIIPAHDEAGYIASCLDALFASQLEGALVQVIVVANGCADGTAAIARTAAEPDRDLQVIETPEGGKPGALELGDAAARHGTRIYLDADVIVSPGLVAALIVALDVPGARYASGEPMIAPAQSAVTRAYAHFWQGQPFVTEGVPGFGIFAVNAVGRSRWGTWPQIISDDTFARLQFAASERVRVPHSYQWPMVEGWRNLVRVRRRQDRGVAEIRDRYPQLATADAGASAGTDGILFRAARDPLGFLTYAAVSLAVRLPGPGGWVRGR